MAAQGAGHGMAAQGAGHGMAAQGAGHGIAAQGAGHGMAAQGAGHGMAAQDMRGRPVTLPWFTAALEPDPARVAPLHGIAPEQAQRVLEGDRGLPAGTFRNPVFPGAAPDPTIARDPATGTYYVYVTHNVASGGRPHGGSYMRVPVISTEDFSRFIPRGEAMPEKPAWVAPESIGEALWAPHVEAPEDPRGTWLLYFSGFHEQLRCHGIGVAAAASPLGPFVADREPLAVGPGYTVIDPFVFHAPDGGRWLYWGSGHAAIEVQELSPDGRGLVGERREVLHPSERYGGYMRLVEAFKLTHQGGLFVARFSGDDTHIARYAVMEEHAESMFGPFRALSDHPILQGNPQFQGPGHHDSFWDDAGQEFILYHAFIGEDRLVRVLMLDRIDQDDRHFASINGGRGPSTTPQPLPRVAAAGSVAGG